MSVCVCVFGASRDHGSSLPGVTFLPTAVSAAHGCVHANERCHSDACVAHWPFVHLQILILAQIELLHLKLHFCRTIVVLIKNKQQQPKRMELHHCNIVNTLNSRQWEPVERKWKLHWKLLGD